MRQLTHHSSTRENVFEHMFLGQLGAEMLARGLEYDELHSSVDKEGFDVLLEAGSIQRHTQLKVKIRDGKRADVTVHTRLATRPSGCVVWLTYDPTTRAFCDIRWLGGRPGEPLPALGNRIARHSRANSMGIKAERAEHRVVALNRFERLDDIAHLVDRLFGRLPADPLDFLRSRMTQRVSAGPDWLEIVAGGNFAALPANVGWEEGVALGQLINGYHLLELLDGNDPAAFLAQQRVARQSAGAWPGDAAHLWTTLFLEARSGHIGSDVESQASHLSQLVQQLRDALLALEAEHA